MYEHRLHHFGSYSTNTAARRRQIRAARKRTAATRARMSERYATTSAASDSLHGSETAE